MARFPEADFVRKSFTIRKMDFPPEVAMTKRSLLRWFALSFGLISPNESRSTVLDVLDGFFFFQVSKNYSPTTYELLDHMKEQQKKIDEKLLRYHLKRLIDVGLVERRKGKLSFVNSPNADPKDIVSGFNHNIAVPLHESVSNISVALEKLNEKYKN
ncbi:MAG TPA: hypothetical protein VFF13_03970 [archaeon]|nr:hypothetical protein [archaeon]